MPSNPAVLKVTGVSSTGGYGPVWYPDTSVRPFNIGISCVVSSTGTVSYSIEHTHDYIGYKSSHFVGFVSSAATWTANTGISGASTNANGNYAFPVTAVRLNVSSATAAGTVTAILVQAG